MAKVALMALGQLVGSDINKSITELAKLSARDSWLPFYPAHWVMTVCKLQWDNWFGGNIAKYRKGEMTTPEFITFLKGQISTSANDQDMKDAWNAMCVLSESGKEKLQDLARHVFATDYSKLISLAIVSTTNELHWEFIKEQIKGCDTRLSLALEGKVYPKVTVLKSFEEKTLDVKLLVNKALIGLDVATNTIYTFIHTAAAVPSMGIQNAKIVVCEFDKNKTFEEMLAQQVPAHLKKAL